MEELLPKPEQGLSSSPPLLLLLLHHHHSLFFSHLTSTLQVATIVDAMMASLSAVSQLHPPTEDPRPEDTPLLDDKKN